MDQEQYTRLMERWDGVPDPRQARGKRYGWPLLLTLITAALACGQRQVEAMGDWVKHRREELCEVLELKGGRVPSTATLRRALAKVDVTALEREASRWPLDPVEVAEGQLPGRAVDGKVLRGAGRQGRGVCLVGYVEHATGRVLDQEAVADKSNEITAVPTLLARSTEKGVVITMDALLTQRSIAEQILAQGMHYLMVAKDNQPRLTTSIAAHFLDRPPEMRLRQFPSTDKGHGRLERRRLEVADAPQGWIDWPGARQILRRTCWRTQLKTGKSSCQVGYAVTDLDPSQASPSQLEALWRGHWTIENRVHYVRDVTLGEDLCQARVGNTPRSLAILRNLILNRLRCGPWPSLPAAQRQLGADISKAFSFLAGVPADILFPP